jgi:hypothetical protein
VHPGAGEGPKGPSVRRLKHYVSWVQSVVRQQNESFQAILSKLQIRPLTVSELLDLLLL